MRSELVFQSPDASGLFYSALHRLIGQPEHARMRVAVAFATRAGVSLLAEAVRARCVPLEIQVVVGLDGQVTEPEAIELLAQLYPGAVRCFASGGVDTMFHSKAFCFDAEGEQGHFTVLVGSANLSKAGLVKNRESGAVFQLAPGEGESAREYWETWWQQLWGAAEEVTSDLVTNYRRIYRRSPRRLPPDHPGREETEGATSGVAQASALWLEVGAITGGSASQLEIPREVVAFFGADPEHYHARLPIVLLRGASAWPNVMAYYPANAMWRINLNTNIPEVRERRLRGAFIHFHRTMAPQNYRFEALDEVGIRPFRSASEALGSARSTLSRSYGWL